jgi:hypothetical protein
VITLPSLLLGFVISTLYGFIFHFWRHGGLGRMLLYLILSWVGFWAGHLLASQLNIKFDSLGPLHLGAATLGSFFLLFIGYWLSLVEVDRN